MTQFFWGFLQIFIYQAFYEGSTNTAPITYGNLVSYIWLQQAFFALIFIRHKDNELTSSIKNGTVAYELVRPYKLYFWWLIKCIAKKYAAVLLRFFPVLALASILPAPYNLSLPASPMSFILFLCSLFLGSFIVSAIAVITQTIVFFTFDDKGIVAILNVIMDILSGMVLPLPLMPNILKGISQVLPFRLIGDLSFRVYSGDISLLQGTYDILYQIFWIIVLVLIGSVIIQKATKKLYIQGG